MKQTLTRTRTAFKFEDADDGMALYVLDLDADDDPRGRRVYTMDQQVYDDMGRPENITITVDPGRPS
jgi:hypothetical protein